MSASVRAFEAMITAVIAPTAARGPVAKLAGEKAPMRLSPTLPKPVLANPVDLLSPWRDFVTWFVELLRLLVSPTNL